MVTDDERREVARRLRESAENGIYTSAGHVLADIFGISGNSNIFDRLADLIEPPTQCPYYHSDRHYCSAYDDVVDRDALLALAEELEDNDVTYSVSTQYVLDDYARRIRKALGEGES